MNPTDSFWEAWLPVSVLLASLLTARCSWRFKANACGMPGSAVTGHASEMEMVSAVKVDVRDGNHDDIDSGPCPQRYQGFRICVGVACLNICLLFVGLLHFGHTFQVACVRMPYGFACASLSSAPLIDKSTLRTPSTLLTELVFCSAKARETAVTTAPTPQIFSDDEGCSLTMKLTTSAR